MISLLFYLPKNTARRYTHTHTNMYIHCIGKFTLIRSHVSIHIYITCLFRRETELRAQHSRNELNTSEFNNEIMTYFHRYRFLYDMPYLTIRFFIYFTFYSLYIFPPYEVRVCVCVCAEQITGFGLATLIDSWKRRMWQLTYKCKQRRDMTTRWRMCQGKTAL